MKKAKSPVSEYKKVIYPKEYGGCIFFSILFFILPSCGIPVFISIANRQPLHFINIILGYTVALIFGVLFTYGIASVYKLIRKKVYIEFDQTGLKYRGVFKTVSVEYSYISLIRVDIFRGFNSMKVFYKTGTIHNKNARVVIIFAWFSYKDLRKVVEIIKKNNKRIAMHGVGKIS